MTMAMAIDDTLDFNFSDYASTTPDGLSWSDWSPVLDLEDISGGHDDFLQLIPSLMAADNVDQERYCNSASTDRTMMMTTDEADVHGGDSKGLRLIHLLTAAAEALSGETQSHALARVVLTRLNEILSSDSITTNMERLAAHFTEALQGLLDGRRRGAAEHHHPMDFIAALQLTQDMSPYVKFGHFTANQAILEAAIGYKRVHVVDYEIMEGIQWPALMQALVSRQDATSAPPPHLRITALSRGGTGLRSIWSTVHETGRRLTSFAKATGLSFSFHQCRLDSDETFSPSSLKLVNGEALIFNCMLHVSHFTSRTATSIGSVLSGAKSLNPQLITMVEEEVGCSPKNGSFVERFMDSLHHYSAIYDSLESGFPIHEEARALVERVFLGPKIAGTLDRIYRAGEGSWAERLHSIGFEPVKISFSNNCQAKLLLGLFNDGFRVEKKLSDNRLVLSWKLRRLLSASVWTCSSDDSKL